MSKRTKAKQIVLGLPLDGFFGTTNVPGVDQTDNPTEAMDKIIKIIDLLAPPASPNLSSRSLSIPSSYSGRECSASASPGVNYPVVIDDTTPTANVNAEFSDGDTGTLDAKVNTVSDGLRILTAADDTGTYGALEILTDNDPYVGPPNEGFWKSLTARMTTTSALPTDNTVQNYEMDHTDTGATDLDFKVDTTPVTPSIVPNAVNPLDVKTGYTTIYISGVPSISTGDQLECDFVINNAVSRFYHSTRIGAIQDSTISNLNVANPLAVPSPSGSMTINEDVTVLNNVFDTDINLNFTGYNVKNVSSSVVNVKRSDGSGSASDKIFIDTISDESIRVRSGQGNYPAFNLTGAANYGQPYTTTISQMVIGASDVVEEIQLIGGVFKYPSGDYTNNYPVVGPNYTSITGQKWVTFSIGSISNTSSVSFRFNGPNGINEEAIGSTVTLNMDCQVIVEGSTGWLDANTKYVTGDPSSNGDACYDVAGSPNDGITRRCTFGTQTLSGNVYVRIGLPTSSTKNFTDVVKV